MSEKATLVDKIPPVSKEAQKAKVTAKTAPSENKASQSAKVETKAVESVPGEHEAIGISKLEQTTYYSFLGNMVIMGIIGFLFAAKAFKNTKATNFKASAGFAVFALALALYYFIMKGTFADGLNGIADSVSFSFRAFAWMILGPSLFLVLSTLDSIKIQGKSAMAIPLCLSAAIFAFIGLAQMGDFGQGIKLAFSALAIICSASLTLGIFTFLAKLPDEMDDNFIKGFQIVVLVIACGWFGYPMVSTISLFVSNSPLFHLLINLIDVVTIAAIAYGFHICMTFKIGSSQKVEISSKGIKKPKMVNAPGKPKTPAPPKKRSNKARSLMD